MSELKKAVVNGSLGSIGLSLIKVLLNHGVQVYAIAFPGDSRIERIPSGATIISCDMKELDEIEKLIHDRIDAFFDLAWAGPIGPGRDDMLLQTQNIKCAVEAVAVADHLGCKVFVGVGSQAEYGRFDGKLTPDTPCFPETGYGIAKLCAGRMTRIECKKRGIRHEWARVLSVYGPNDGPMSVIAILLEKLLNGEKPSLTSGEQIWDYIYADDAAEALVCMAESGKDGAIYPVGSGNTRSLKEYFSILRNEIDPSLPLGLGEIPYNANQVMHLEADISDLTRDTGFVPKTSFEEGIKETVRLYRERKARVNG